MFSEPTGNINERAINLLAKSYNALDYAPRLKRLLSEVYPLQSFDEFSKYDLHELLNKTLLANYKGEEVLKYRLFEKYCSKRDIVGAFEIKVNNSRVDFLAINGTTSSFEIKSELDNLSKLSKQVADYKLAFEYNYVVVDERHVQKVEALIPERFGIWSYVNDVYKNHRKAELNDEIDAEVQLNLLTKKERQLSFPEQDGIALEILMTYDDDIINEQFKKALKDRYRKRWQFLIANEPNIFPIDLQFFFNTNIEPKYIYSN